MPSSSFLQNALLSSSSPLSSSPTETHHHRMPPTTTPSVPFSPFSLAVAHATSLRRRKLSPDLFLSMCYVCMLVCFHLFLFYLSAYLFICLLIFL
jgi:hypothetical protein